MEKGRVTRGVLQKWVLLLYHLFVHGVVSLWRLYDKTQRIGGVLKMFWEFGFCRFCWWWSFLLLICCQEMGHMLLCIWELGGVFC